MKTVLNIFLALSLMLIGVTPGVAEQGATSLESVWDTTEETTANVPLSIPGYLARITYNMLSIHSSDGRVIREITTPRTLVARYLQNSGARVLTMSRQGKYLRVMFGARGGYDTPAPNCIYYEQQDLCTPGGDVTGVFVKGYLLGFDDLVVGSEGWNEPCKIYSLTQNRVLYSIPAVNGSPKGIRVALSADGRFLAAESANTIKIFDFQTGRVVCQGNPPWNAVPSDFEGDPDGPSSMWWEGSKFVVNLYWTQDRNNRTVDHNWVIDALTGRISRSTSRDREHPQEDPSSHVFSTRPRTESLAPGNSSSDTSTPFWIGVTRIRGLLDYRRDSTSPWVPFEPSFPVVRGAEFRTGASSEAEITALTPYTVDYSIVLPGTIIRIDTVPAIPRGQKVARRVSPTAPKTAEIGVHVLNGSLRTILKPNTRLNTRGLPERVYVRADMFAAQARSNARAQMSHAITLATGARAAVRGTDFLVAVETGPTGLTDRLDVFEGLVEYSNPILRAPLMLRRGQSIRIDAEGNIQRSTRTDTATRLANPPALWVSMTDETTTQRVLSNALSGDTETRPYVFPEFYTDSSRATVIQVACVPVQEAESYILFARAGLLRGEDTIQCLPIDSTVAAYLDQALPDTLGRPWILLATDSTGVFYLILDSRRFIDFTVQAVATGKQSDLGWPLATLPDDLIIRGRVRW